MSTIDDEMKFLTDAHEKAVQKRISNASFLERCRTLFLSGDLSERSLYAARIMYGDQAKTGAELVADLAATHGSLSAILTMTAKRAAPISSSYSSGCGSSSTSRSSC
jgi:hypothetical protein